MSEAMYDDVLAEVRISHLFSALDAELALQRVLSVYLGKAKLLLFLMHQHPTSTSQHIRGSV